MKKKTISLVLALLMVFSLLPVSAFAANTVQSGTCGDNLTWTLDDAGVLTITGTGGMTSCLWIDFDYRDSIRSVVIGDGVASICDNAFYNCTGITEVSIPDSVTYIADCAFYNCTSLKSIKLPINLTSISSMVFCGCSSLESVRFSNSVYIIYGNAFSGCDALREIYFGGTDMQFALIEIGPGNGELKSATVHCDLEYPFTDIADNGLRDYISLGQAAGIINGYPDGTYRPNNPVTRAQYVTMLYNMCGKPDASGYEVSFNDTNTISASYMDAVKWGVAMGVINGYGDNTFRPNKDISRAEMAAFSYRLIKLVVGGEPTDELKADCSFKDSASIPNVHREAVNVCANLGIIQGFSDGNFRPNSTANRGQAATILVRVAASLGSDE